MRLFIAINIPSEIKAELANLLKGISDHGLKKVSSENLHLTMKFLGEVDEKKAEAIKQRLAEIKAVQFKISLKGIGFFPNGNYIKVVWVGIEEGREEIIALQKEIDSRLSELGFPKERDYQPHLTIARAKYIKDHKKFMEFAESAKISASLEVTSFDLMESSLLPGGPEYRIISGFKLSGD